MNNEVMTIGQRVRKAYKEKAYRNPSDMPFSAPCPTACHKIINYTILCHAIEMRRFFRILFFHINCNHIHFVHVIVVNFLRNLTRHMHADF